MLLTCPPPPPPRALCARSMQRKGSGSSNTQGLDLSHGAFNSSVVLAVANCLWRHVGRQSESILHSIKHFQT